MLFNSFEFLYFFLVVTTCYFVLPHKLRWMLLLVSSCYFYMAFVPVYILILFGTIIIDYMAGICIEKKITAQKQQQARFFLIVSLIANIGILAVFKYYNFFIDNTHVLFQSLGMPVELPYLKILLPIGLSFHTFQAMSYTIEVYRGNQKAERHFGIYALYVMFYPQLVAGPIERPQQMLHQFYEKKTFDYDGVKKGLLLMLFGFFKKVVIADRLGTITDLVFDHPQDYPASSLILAAVCFSFQIYCDFSGYTDIAIGSARVMGFKLMENFNQPYHSRSIAEFWNRWHISLSGWFRDYLYIPLGGNRVALPKWCFNLTIVFLLSGLWHGANWTFIVWGLLHAFYMMTGKLSEKWRNKMASFILPRAWMMNSMNVALTFFLVTIAWIFFRANNLNDALYFIAHMFKYDVTVKLPGGLVYILLSLGLVLVLELIQLLQNRVDLYAWLNKQHLIVRWMTYYAIIAAIIYFGEFDEVQFVYFQF